MRLLSATAAILLALPGAVAFDYWGYYRQLRTLRP